MVSLSRRRYVLEFNTVNVQHLESRRSLTSKIFQIYLSISLVLIWNLSFIDECQIRNNQFFNYKEQRTLRSLILILFSQIKMSEKKLYYFVLAKIIYFRKLHFPDGYEKWLMVIVVINKMKISFKSNVLLSIRSFRAKKLKPFNFDRLFFDWPIESRFGRVRNHLFYSEKMLKTRPFTFFLQSSIFFP